MIWGKMFGGDDGRELPPRDATPNDLYEWRCRMEDGYRGRAECFARVLDTVIGRKYLKQAVKKR